jgi:hypothetical protein
VRLLPRRRSSERLDAHADGPERICVECRRDRNAPGGESAGRVPRCAQLATLATADDDAAFVTCGMRGSACTPSCGRGSAAGCARAARHPRSPLASRRPATSHARVSRARDAGNTRPVGHYAV